MHRQTEIDSLYPISCQEQYIKYKHRVTVIGWLGEVLSTFVLLLTATVLHFRHDVVQLILKQYKQSELDEDDEERIRSVVWLLGSTFYILSLINIIVCSMLLIGVARHCVALLFPWLLFHGIIYGISLYMAIYLVISGILLPIDFLLLCAMILTTALMLFFKIINDVFILFKCMHYLEEVQVSPYELERNDRRMRNREGVSVAPDANCCIHCNI